MQEKLLHFCRGHRWRVKVGRIKLDQDVLGFSVMLERLTGVHVKDCFLDGKALYVVVAQGELGKAVGRGGATIRRVQQECKRRIKVIEFNPHAGQFVRNVIYPLEGEVREEEKTLIIQNRSRMARSLLIGREGRNLKLINRAVQRFFPKEVRIE